MTGTRNATGRLCNHLDGGLVSPTTQLDRSNLINTDLAARSGLDATLTSPDALVQVGILSDAYCDRRHRFIDMTGSAPESGNVWFVVTDTMLLGHVY